MLTKEALFARKNLLRLDNPANFQNTMNVTGACHVRSSWCTDQGNDEVLVTHRPSYFSGYVFRGDLRDPTVILESGFTVDVPFIRGEDLNRVMSGAIKGFTHHYGVSTTICVTSTVHYATTNLLNCCPALMGHVYLIDATQFKGFAIPCPFPNQPESVSFPHLREVYEVNFPNPIPNFKIVGVVYSPKPGTTRRRSFPRFWPDFPSELLLAVNPYYSASFTYGQVKTGMEAAKVVADRFNVLHGWVVV